MRQQLLIIAFGSQVSGNIGVLVFSEELPSQPLPDAAAQVDPDFGPALFSQELEI